MKALKTVADHVRELANDTPIEIKDQALGLTRFTGTAGAYLAENRRELLFVSSKRQDQTLVIKSFLTDYTTIGTNTDGH